MYRVWVKRTLDFIFSLILIILLSPVLLGVGLSVLLLLGRPIIFKQTRPGKDEQLFTLYKFRTMENTMNPSDPLNSDKERLTKFGTFLRKTSLDELPELLNILKGDMSFVGPRPLLVDYLPLYNTFQKQRHNVRPGLTGLAQVNGRNVISWQEKFDHDIKYVTDYSFRLDVIITIKTIITVLKRENVHSVNSPTMEKFEGNHYE